MKVKYGLKVGALNAAILLASLVVAEILFGSWFSKDDYGFLNIPRNIDRVFDVRECVRR